MYAILYVLGVITFIIALSTAIATVILYVRGYFASPGPGGGGTPVGLPGVTSLSALTDVSISTPLQGDALVYSSSISRWVNKHLASACASFSYGGGGSDIPEIYPLTMPTQYSWVEIFTAIGVTPIFTSNNSLFSSPNFSNSATAVQWLKSQVNLFAQVSVSAGAPVSGNTYQIAIFLDNILVEGSVGTINFSINNKVASYSFAMMIPVNQNHSVGIRMRQVTTAIGTFVNITNATLSLFATTTE